MNSIKSSLLAIFLTAIIVSYSCGSGTSSPENNDEPVKKIEDYGPVKKLKGVRKDLNISIFLDLSNRISPTVRPNNSMEYWKRDLGYINTISKAFEVHLRNKKTVTMNDNIKLFMHPLPENISDLNNRLGNLDKEFTRENATLQNIRSISVDYKKTSEIFYKETLKKKETSKKGVDNYPGSDIYDFFKSKVKDYCIKKNKRNILFILTDGYMYMKDTEFKNSSNKSNYLVTKALEKWKFNSGNYENKINEEGFGFQVPINDLNELEVMVIGLHPDESWHLDVLNTYWSKWLKDMGVKNFQDDNWSQYLKKDDLPSNMNNLIQDFMYK